MSQSQQFDPQQVAMKMCSVCSRSLKAAEAHSIKGRVYCSDCLINGAEIAQIANSAQLRNFRPGRAALFALIPGVGAVYNQQYIKAVQHFAIFAALINLAGREGILTLGVVAFYIFTIIDAYRSAQTIVRKRLYQADSGESEAQVSLPLWGGGLILVGVFLFLDNLDVLRLRSVVDFVWPMVFVAVGAHWIWDFYRRPSRSGDEEVMAADAANSPPDIPIPDEGPAPPPTPSETSAADPAVATASEKPVSIPPAPEVPGQPAPKEER